MSVKKGGLGRGLDAIFAENTQESGSGAVMLRISELEPNREQPRKDFDEKAMAELADSISQHGVLQPLLVRPIFGGGYQIVAGERRWRAARMAGLSEVPAMVREMNDGEVMELALIENLQREDLTPLEEARGYQTLLEKYELTQEEVAKTVGKSRPAVTNAMRLLGLPQEIQDMVERGELSAGHGRALLAFADEELMVAVARKAAAEGLQSRRRRSPPWRNRRRDGRYGPQNSKKQYYQNLFSKNIKTIDNAHRIAILGSKIVRLIFRDFRHETLFFHRRSSKYFSERRFYHDGKEIVQIASRGHPQQLH